MNFFNNPEYNSVKVLLFIVLAVFVGYFAFRYVHPDALTNTGAVGTMTPSTPSCGAALLSPAADAAFTATNVTAGTTNPVASFVITNTSPCAVAINRILMTLPVATPTSRTSILNDIQVSSGGVAFGPTLSTTGPGPLFGMSFISTIAGGGLVIPGLSSVTIKVNSAILAGTSHDTFQVQLYGLSGVVVPTRAAYSWVYRSGMTPVVSNLMTVL